MPSKRILVTGGAGFLGSALCARLVADGHEVWSMDNGSRGSHRVDGVLSTALSAAWDVCDAYAVNNLALSAEIETVFHLAAVNGTARFYRDPARVLDVQIRGTLNVLDACRANGIKDLVLFSSSEVYATPEQIPTPESTACTVPDITNPRFSYGGGKIAAELLCWHAPHIDRLRIVRPHNVYGPGMGYDHVIPELIMRLDRSREHGTIEVADPYATRAFCYVDDFIDGVVTAWQSSESRAIYHVGTEQETEIGNLALQIAELMGTRRLAVRATSAPAGSPKRRCPDTARLRALGWVPRVTLDEGLRRTIDGYMAARESWPKVAA